MVKLSNLETGQQVAEVEDNLCRRITARLSAHLEAQSHSPARVRPRVGILGGVGTLRDWGGEVYSSDRYSTDAIFKAGGLPVGLPAFQIIPGLDPLDILHDPDAFSEVFDVVWSVVCDLEAFVFTGGGDLDSRLFYQEIPHPRALPPDRWRDVWEWFCALLAWITYTPALGICRGFQLMNVVRGGGVYQDTAELRAQWRKGMPHLLNHRKGRPIITNMIEHPLIIKQNSWLARAVRGRGDFAPLRYFLDAVLTQHHQFIAYLDPDSEEVVGKLAPGMVVAGYAPDRVIEAIADEDPLRNFVAVGFHPELVSHLDWANGIFSYIVDAALPYASPPREWLEVFRDEIHTWLWLYGRAALCQKQACATGATRSSDTYNGHRPGKEKSTDALTTEVPAQISH